MTILRETVCLPSLTGTVIAHCADILVIKDNKTEKSRFFYAEDEDEDHMDEDDLKLEFKIEDLIFVSNGVIKSIKQKENN